MNKVMDLWNAIVDVSGVEDPEDLRMTEEEKQQATQKADEERQAAMEAEKAQAQNQLHQEDTKQIINYKDAPEDIKRQMEAGEGFQPSQGVSPGQQMIDQKAENAGLDPEMALKADKQEHDKEMDRAKIALEAEKLKKEAQKPKTDPKKGKK